MKVDLSEMARRYSEMSQEQFSRIERGELTEEGRTCYDREVERHPFSSAVTVGVWIGILLS